MYKRQVPGVNAYTVSIRNLSLAGGPVILQRVVKAPRHYFHEGDFQFAGTNGLPQAGYEWFVYTGDASPAASGTNVILWSASQSVPSLITPSADGATLIHSWNEFRWTMDEETTEFQLEIRRGGTSGVQVLNITDLAPYREVDGTYSYMPFYAGEGEFTNGVYWWRVRGINPRVVSAYSDWGIFTIDLGDRPGGPSSISGDVLYFGKVPVDSNGVELIVEAYDSRGFSLMPRARITLTNKGPFSLTGLPAGTYYMRAFIDMNGNRTLDTFESYGFLKDSGPFADSYDLAALTVPGSIVGRYIVIRDQDTDGDKLPDAWEYWYCTCLLYTSPSPRD